MFCGRHHFGRVENFNAHDIAFDWKKDKMFAQMLSLRESSLKFLMFAMEIHTIWTYLGKILMDAYTISSIIVPVWSELDWRIHTKSESGDQAWFVNSDNIVNINIFRISIKIIPNIKSTKFGYQWQPYLQLYGWQGTSWFQKLYIYTTFRNHIFWNLFNTAWLKKIWSLNLYLGI